MKAILRGGAGLLGLLLFSSLSFGYVLVSPVFKQTYPHAPDLYNSGGYYYVNGWGQVVGPCYYVVPPCQPFNGMLPGKTGAAIMSGNLPHTLLLSKEGLVIGNVPLVGKKHDHGAHDYGNAGAGMPQSDRPQGAYMQAGGPSQLGPMQVPYGHIPTMPQMPNLPTMPPMPTMQVPYVPMPMPYPMQGPYGVGPMPYPAQMPYGQAPMPYPMQVPYGAGPMPYPAQMPYGPAPMPYSMQPRMPMAYYPMSYDPRGVAQAQNVGPGAQPFMTIPGFNGPMGPGIPTPPNGPMPPQRYPMPPMPPSGPMPPSPGYPQADQLNRFTPFNPMQPMAPPMGQMEPMQLPRMDFAPPPPMKVGGNAYPTHPFVRSPRDFFMWGENMEDEQRARRRPFPVP